MTVTLPPSLPARLYLLAYDPRKQRPVTYRMRYALRAAALADLWLGGQLVDSHGRPKVAGAGSATTVTDPVLAGMLAQIEASKPRLWEHWIRRPDRSIRAAVRDQLAGAGLIHAEPRRVALLFHADRVTIRDPLLVERLHGTVADTLRPGHQPAQLDPRDAALTALAAAGEARTALTRAQARAHRTRLAQLETIAGPAPRALRKAVKHARSSSAG